MKHNHNIFIFLIVSAIIISIYLILQNEVFKNKEHFVVEFKQLQQKDLPYSPENINVYSIEQTPIAGLAGVNRKLNPNLPKIGFKTSEVNNLEVKIISENGIEYVDNASMVPYLHSQIKYLTAHIDELQSQFSDFLKEI